MLKVLTSLIFTLLYSNALFADVLQEHKKHLGNKIELLFFQYAGAGEIVSKANSNCYQLVLQKLNDRVIYISDAPARVTGSYSIPEFVTAWQHHESSAHVKPNAILHAKTTDHQSINDTAIFSNIAYDAKNATLTYTLCPIDKKKPLAQGKLESISIFIDPFHPWPP